jgi:hypothetical protein
MAKSRRKAVPAEAAAEASDRGLPVNPLSASDITAASADRDRIAIRAYELYLARGCSDGRDMDDWFAAEREVTNGGSDRDRDEQ